jgi:geranylgeranyl diphosphate synthase type II
MNGCRSEPLKEALGEAVSWVEAGLNRLPMFEGSLSRLPEMARYSLSAGGKRIRPFLVMQACKAGERSLDRALPSACAVEMIHSYSLVHDDLPSLDNDDLRRGKPALHRAFDPVQAVLAGDLLLSEAFLEVVRTPLGPGTVGKMLGCLARAAGPSRLVGGQYMDIYHPDDPSRDWIDKMISGKTAAMIRASLELGSIAGGFDDAVISEVSSAGERLGFLFQLTDDILDRCGTETEMGKRVGKDENLDKANLVTRMGLDAAVEKSDALSIEIADEFSALPGDWEMVSALAAYLPHRRK